MQPIATPGTRQQHRFRVTEEMCPHFDEQLVHPVCATWTLVHHMEYTGRLLILPCLEPGEEAVGARFEIQHRSPAGIGSEIVITGTVTEASRRKLTCDLTAHVAETLVAEAAFTQISRPHEELKARFRAATPE